MNSAAEREEVLLYAGAEGLCDGGGIVGVRLDPASGFSQVSGSPAPVARPLWLTRGTGGVIYAASATGAGSIVTLRPGPDGQLQAAGSVPSGGEVPCHMTLIGHRWLLTANYTGGTAAVHPIRDDGTLGPPRDVQSLSPEGGRSHPHQMHATPDRRWVLVSDLGNDRVHALHFDADRGNLRIEPDGGISLPAGVGPRNLAFLAPDSRDALLVGELDSTVTWLEFDPATGRLMRRGAIRATELDSGSRNYPSCIEPAGDGRHAYVLNRGSHTVSVIAPTSREIAIEQEIPTGGQWPMQLAVFPSGVLVANRDSDSLAWLGRAAQAWLAAARAVLRLPRPTCLTRG